MYQFNEEEYRKRMEWYVDARFGMFLHWGALCDPGERRVDEKLRESDR